MGRAEMAAVLAAGDSARSDETEVDRQIDEHIDVGWVKGIGQHLANPGELFPPAPEAAVSISDPLWNVIPVRAAGGATRRSGIAKQGEQPGPRLHKKGRGLWPLLQDDGTREGAAHQPLDNAPNARLVFPGRPGKERQAVVGFAIVLVQVDMDDRHLRFKKIKEPQIVISCRRAEVGMSKVKAHTHQRQAVLPTGADMPEEFIEIIW